MTDKQKPVKEMTYEELRDELYSPLIENMRDQVTELRKTRK